MSRDRPGIVSAVSGAVSELGGNITHLSETVLRGYFTIILSVESPDALEASELRAAVERAGKPGEFQAGVLPYEEAATVAPAHRERFVLTVRCHDRKGIIHEISRTLAERQVNIDDFYAYVLNGELIMILEIGVAPGTEQAQIQDEIDALAERTDIQASLQHANIFRATTELQAVLRLGDQR